jgi:hypothetical protein
MRYDFEWDPKTAGSNLRKHKVGFERAATIFRDSNLISIPDQEHSESKERWITMGLDDRNSPGDLAQIRNSGGNSFADQDHFSQESNQKRKATI